MWNEFSQSPNNSCECDPRRKSTVRTSTVLFQGEINCARKAPWRTLSDPLISVFNTLRRLSAKCAGYHVFEPRQVRYGIRQVCVGTKGGAELASIVFCCLIESPVKQSVILEGDFESVFKSIN